MGFCEIYKIGCWKLIYCLSVDSGCMRVLGHIVCQIKKIPSWPDGGEGMGYTVEYRCYFTMMVCAGVRAISCGA